MTIKKFKFKIKKLIAKTVIHQMNFAELYQKIFTLEDIIIIMLTNKTKFN